MISPQTPYTVPPIEERPSVPQHVVPEYSDQDIEYLAQRLMPRLMPEILYQLRVYEPAQERNRAFGKSLALAIVTLVQLVPLSAIMLGIVDTLGGGISAALIGIAIIGVVIVLVNVLFNYLLFNTRRQA